MGVTIHQISMQDAKEILEFEINNREFFEASLPARNESFFTLYNIKKSIEEAERDAEKDLCYMYIIRNDDGEIVGRINLFSIIRGIFKKSELGYRVGERHNGQGYATRAVALAVKEAFQYHGLHRIEASTDPGNRGSQIVLIKNGFQFVGRAQQYIYVNGKWHDSIHFERLKFDEGI